MFVKFYISFSIDQYMEKNSEVKKVKVTSPFTRNGRRILIKM
jgi:hypothetical protein